MGEILIKSFTLENHKNSLKEFSRETQNDSFEIIVEKISKSHVLFDSTKVCYIFGMGKHPKSTYLNLKKIDDIHLVWYGSLLPFALKPFNFIIANYYGIYKIHKLDAIIEPFLKLSESSMVGLYIFNKKFENSFIEQIKAKKINYNLIDSTVKDDAAYFIYKVDTDNLESKTGMYEIISVGKECPKELLDIVI